MIRTILITLLLFGNKSLYADEHKWISYLGKNEILDIALGNEYVWGLLPWGLIRWNKQDHTYVTFTTEDIVPGTPNQTSKISAITIDTSDNLWAILVNNGVLRYNGNTWKHYGIADSLSTTQYMCIAADLNGGVWIGGYWLTHYDGGKFINYSGKVHFNNEYIKNIECAEDGTVYFFGGGRSFFTNSHTFGIPYGKEINSTSYSFYDCYEINDVLCYGTDGRNLFKAYIDPIRLEKNYERILQIYDVISNSKLYLGFNQIAVDHNGVIWASIESGGLPDQYINDEYFPKRYLARIDSLGNKTVYDEDSGLFEGHISEMIVDAQNNLWIATQYGIFEYDGKNVTRYYADDGPISSVNDLVFDGNTLWAASDLGVLKYTGQKWDYFNSKDGMYYTPTKTIDARNGMILAGFKTSAYIDGSYNGVYYGGLASTLNGINWSNYPFIQNLPTISYYKTRYPKDLIRHVNQVRIDNNGTYWIAHEQFTYYNVDDYPLHTVDPLIGGGISFFNPVTGSTAYFDSTSGLGSNVVYGLTFDKDNTCWISTYKGLVSYDGVKWESYPQVKGDKPVIDKNDFLWIYGSGKFTCYDGTRWSVFPIINGQVTNPDSVTFSSFQGKLWIQASSDLASFDGTTWTVYKCGVDLPFKSFNSFAEDPNGNLWFATSQGIYEWILNPEPVNVKEDEPELAPLVLNGNYPNPFNAETTIKYTLYKPAKIKIEIYNVAGQRVQTLDSGMQDIGAHEIVWDSRAFSSGIYFYKLLSGNEINIGRMMLMK